MATTAESAADATLPRTKEKVSELTKAAALQYTLKNFFNASELYSQAVEIQTELNGELAPENAELLFYYGRALYKNAFQKSDVLGTKVAQEEKKKPKVEKQAAKAVAESSNGAAKGGAKGETVESKPYFQLTGDENWTDSEDDEDAEGGEGEEEEEDDFQNSYGAFEMARVCYEKQLDALGASDSADKGKGKAEITPQQRAIMEKIADCHGFLAEISLENERFHDAVADARKSLALAEQLHAFEDERVSEAHYVLSLALEMASNYKLREDLAAIEPGTSADGTEANQGAQQPEESEIDYDMRNEAAKQTELAIQSVEARLKKENANLAKPDITAEEKKEKEAIIKDKEGALEDLKLRVGFYSAL
jgi:HAT1-interacting factor 1